MNIDHADYEESQRSWWDQMTPKEQLEYEKWLEEAFGDEKRGED